MTAPTRTLRELIDEGKAQLAPMQATLEQMGQMSKQREPLIVHDVVMDNTEQFGIRWTLHIERSTGEHLLIGLWANPQRDLTCSSLLELTQSGPVAGILLTNAGTDKKPFWLIDAA